MLADDFEGVRRVTGVDDGHNGSWMVVPRASDRDSALWHRLTVAQGEPFIIVDVCLFGRWRYLVMFPRRLVEGLADGPRLRPRDGWTRGADAQRRADSRLMLRSRRLGDGKSARQPALAEAKGASGDSGQRVPICATDSRRKEGFVPETTDVESTVPCSQPESPAFDQRSPCMFRPGSAK